MSSYKVTLWSNGTDLFQMTYHETTETAAKMHAHVIFRKYFPSMVAEWTQLGNEHRYGSVIEANQHAAVYVKSVPSYQESVS